MINFWATWCGPVSPGNRRCSSQMYRKYKPMGFTILGVNVEPDSERRRQLAEGNTGELSDPLQTAKTRSASSTM